MFKKIKALFLILILIFSFNQVFAADVPVIVIAPSKKAQSSSTVGTSIIIYDENDINNSADYFLGDILSFSSPSLNSYQSGGYGQTSGIQLRGLPKRYSTVYIDGVKMSDPSMVSGDYYFDDLLKSQISRVEILKGNQSSIYGSGAMGGTINITTKRGKPGIQKEFSANTGSNSIYNILGSIAGADEKNDFYLGLERFETAGMSAMTDNDEKDLYRNGTVVANYGRKISDILKFQSNFRFMDTFSHYDGVDNSSVTNMLDNATEHTKEANGNVGLIYKLNDQFTNNFTYSHFYSSRSYDEPGQFSNMMQEDSYFGERDVYTYAGSYNINLDNSITFGVEREDDAYDYEKSGNDDTLSSVVTSQYIDYQTRLTKNLFATAGARHDEHDEAGDEDSHRASLAYLFDDKLTKLKTSYGTSFRFPSLFEMHKIWNGTGGGPIPYAERGESWDLGVEKTFVNSGVKFDLTYFDHRYFDTIDAWKDGSADVNENTHNQNAVVKSQGIELMSKWKKSDFLNFDFNYTYTNSYDGADWIDYTEDNHCSCGIAQSRRMVRVPKHNINLTTNFRIPSIKKMNFSLQTKYSDEMRDYGNNNSAGSVADGVNWVDVILDDYLVNNLAVDYDLPGYKAYFKLYNIFDEGYNTALDYAGMERSYNFGIRKSY